MNILADSDQPVIIFFDEFAILVNRMLKGSDYQITPERIKDVDVFMSWLRENSIRHKGKLRIVLTGSIGIEPVLRQARLSATLNNYSPFDLPPWDSTTALGCLEALANQYGINLPKKVCEQMVEKLGYCVPHHVQTFFDALYNECRYKNITEATIEMVDEIYYSRMLGIRGQAQLNHFEERLKLVLGEELNSLALELLTETAVVGELTVENAIYLCRQYQFRDMKSEDALKEILEIFEHDGYLKKIGKNYKFNSHLLKDWWKARFESFYTRVSVRRES